jgi:two-component system OmpR family response regulator
VISVEIILQELWTIEFEGESNVVERHICRLRVKLNVHSSHHHIETLRGRGYRLAA